MSLPRRLVRLFPLVLATVLVLLVFVAPRRALACGGGGGGSNSSGGSSMLTNIALVAGIGIVAADGTFATYDVVKAAQGEHASKGMAIAEVSLMAPQMLVAGAYVTSETPKTTAGWVLSAIPTVMFLHGFITLVSVDWAAERAAPLADGAMLVNPYATTSTKPEPTVRAPEARMRISFAPTVLPGGTPSAPTMIPGIGAWGAF